MPVNTPASSQSFGRTFIVAAAILGGLAALQLGAVGYAFFNKPAAAVNTEESSEPPPKIDVSNFPVVEQDEPLSVNTDPIAEMSPETGRIDPRPVAVPENLGVTSAIGGNPPRPTPVPLSAFTPKQNPRFAELVEQGKLLRNDGDTARALVKFREAAMLEPLNPLPYAETAYTFEKMGLADKAGEQWRQILAMGEIAGVYYSAAQAKLNLAIADTRGALSPRPAPATSIPDGKALVLNQPRVEELMSAASEKKFILRVPIRARGDEPISVRDMKVFVLFFERINGKDIVRTTANVSNRWENPPIDWAGGEETLEVSYDLPASQGRGEPRTYHGYIIRLYYKGELQDAQAQPASLNQKFPAEDQLPE